MNLNEVGTQGLRKQSTFWLLFGGDQKNCRFFLTLVGSIRRVARTFPTRRLAIGYMRLGEQGAYCRHAAPAAGGQPRPRYARAGEHGRAPSWPWSMARIWMSERTLQEQTITRGSHFRNVLNCRYSNQLHTHCGYEAQILFPANPTSRRFLWID